MTFRVLKLPLPLLSRLVFITIGVGTESGASTEPPMTGGTYTFTVTLTANQVN